MSAPQRFSTTARELLRVYRAIKGSTYQLFFRKDEWKGGDPAARSRTATLLRLHPNHQSQFHYRQAVISVAMGFRGVTGGVYKARERIHRCLLISDY